MTNTMDFDRAVELFEQAAELPESEREVFLRDACEGQEHLFTELLKLFAHYKKGDRFLESEVERESELPNRIGPYRILEVIGEGGMGTVYMAEQREPVHRPVALKIIKLGMDTKQVLARFEAERQALALMDHANIARVLDGGKTSSGQPYFVMELVKGLPITKFCDRDRLSLRERISLFRQVCEGVQHAHQKGVIHRDIKPSNVFVTLLDDKAAVKIIDFGLARAVDYRLGSQTVHTEHGVLVGTPAYMSPEQAEMSGLDIDTRTDVYSLGVLLYELLTGHLPLDLSSRGPSDSIQRRLLHEQPPKPSARFLVGNDCQFVADCRGSSVRSLAQNLRGDLDWIATKALEKDRRRRYQAPLDLLADLNHYLNDEPVLAGPPTVLYRSRKFIKKYRRQLGVAAVVFVALAVALVVTLSAWREASSALLNYARLADSVKLENFERVAKEELWPETPAKVPEMKRWLMEVATWQQQMEEHDHEHALGELRLSLGTHGGAPGVWVFEDDEDQFLHDALANLVTERREFNSGGGTVAMVGERLSWAEDVARKTLEEYSERWTETTRAIREEERYGGLSIEPQLGLVPLGQDPESKLFEFSFARSGAKPVRDQATNRWNITKEIGIVFVLIPGGDVTIGSQLDNSEAANYYDHTLMGETPLIRGRIKAFFLSKYEMTQAQWGRLARADNPSEFHPTLYGHPTYTTEVTSTNPVENVTWSDAQAVLQRHGLLLPTEPQWEYACRAGTDTPWWTGRNEESLRSKDGPLANIADAYTRRPGPGASSLVYWPDAALWPEYLDDHFWHAPVGFYPANPFGLHEVLGNVSEWCREVYRPYSSNLQFQPDGTWSAPGPKEGGRVNRGGSFYRSAEWARSARRAATSPDSRYNNVGFRPARALQ